MGDNQLWNLQWVQMSDRLSQWANMITKHALIEEGKLNDIDWEWFYGP